MHKQVLLLSLLLLPALLRAQVEGEADDDSPASYMQTAKEKPYYPPLYRIGIFANPVFSTSKIRTTDFIGTHDSRNGYTPFTYGLSIRGDFGNWGLETGVALIERKFDLSAGNSRSPYQQQIRYQARMSCIDIPLIYHPVLVRPDEVTVVSPFIGMSVNLLSLSHTSSFVTSSTSDPAAALTRSISASVPNVGFSAMFGTSIVKDLPVLGKLEVGLSYQVDMANLPNVHTRFTYTTASGTQVADNHFKTINQGIRFRVIYYFANFPKAVEEYEEYPAEPPHPNTPEYEMGPPPPPPLSE